MWPSFSLCACRILKMRSCLRMPLAPGRSSARAILVSSVMFFSFSSAIVIFTYGVFLELIWEDATVFQRRGLQTLEDRLRTPPGAGPAGFSGRSIMQRDARVRQLRLLAQ